MKILVIGKIGSITHWLEDCAAAWRADGHDVRVSATRNPAIHPGIEGLLLSRGLGQPLARRLVARARRFSPDLIVAIGAFHIPIRILEHLASWPTRPPMLGWVGDRFDAGASEAARLYDTVLYTDRGLLAGHRRLGFDAQAHFLPHAANPHANGPHLGRREKRMVFVGAPTLHRRSLVAELKAPIALYGPGWTAEVGGRHEVAARRISPEVVRSLYRRYSAALNIPNENNVVTGLNQRNFDPCLAATPVVAESQADLEVCFEPGREVLVFRDAAELNEIHGRLMADPDQAERVGQAGRARVLADHTYGRRLEAMKALL